VEARQRIPNIDTKIIKNDIIATSPNKNASGQVKMQVTKNIDAIETI
jgi:hypothetical protein